MLRIAYIAGVEELRAAFPIKRKVKSSKLDSARQWMAKQETANYLKALQEYEKEIKSIQKREPGFLPK